MTIQEMQKRKKELGYTYAEIAHLSGLPLPTVQKVLGGITRSPRYDTILALEKVLAAPDDGVQCSHGDIRQHSGTECAQEFGASPHTASSEPVGKPYNIPRPSASSIRNMLAGENTPSYSSSDAYESGYIPTGNGTYIRRYPDSHPLLPQKRQGEYTAKDRSLLPEDVRTELIDGVLYDMASPKAVHQIILMELSAQLYNQIQKCGKDCMVFVAPSDVWLTGDDKNIFQPDIYVICDFTMIDGDGYTKGAPPFVIEILSSSTRSRDLLLKSYKYHAAGVREYWIVDPEKEQVVVYDYDRFPDGTENTVYTFSDIVPVGFSGSSCHIDFRRIPGLLAKIGK